MAVEHSRGVWRTRKQRPQPRADLLGLSAEPPALSCPQRRCPCPGAWAQRAGSRPSSAQGTVSQPLGQRSYLPFAFIEKLDSGKFYVFMPKREQLVAV